MRSKTSGMFYVNNKVICGCFSQNMGFSIDLVLFSPDTDIVTNNETGCERVFPTDLLLFLLDTDIVTNNETEYIDLILFLLGTDIVTNNNKKSIRTHYFVCENCHYHHMSKKHLPLNNNTWGGKNPKMCANIHISKINALRCMFINA